MKKFLALLLILTGIVSLTGCSTADQEYSGVIRLCTPIDQNKVVLLYNNKIYSSPHEPPVNEDTLCIYNIDTQAQELIFQGNDIWGGYADQLIVAEGKIIYSNGDKILEFAKQKDQWQAHEFPTDNMLKAISPDGDKYIERRDEDLTVFGRQTNEILAQTTSIKNIGQMKWRNDGKQIAMVADSNTSVALWNWQSDETKKLTIGQELPETADWVDIMAIDYSSDGQYLLITFLCESGSSLVFWDNIAEETVDQLTFAGDLIILDAQDDRVLCAVDEGQEKHLLIMYDCSSKKMNTLEQGTLYYTEGCFIDETHILINKFEPEQQSNALSVMEIDS